MRTQNVMFLQCICVILHCFPNQFYPTLSRDLEALSPETLLLNKGSEEFSYFWISNCRWLSWSFSSTFRLRTATLHSYSVLTAWKNLFLQIIKLLISNCLFRLLIIDYWIVCNITVLSPVWKIVSFLASF